MATTGLLAVLVAVGVIASNVDTWAETVVARIDPLHAVVAVAILAIVARVAFLEIDRRLFLRDPLTGRTELDRAELRWLWRWYDGR